MTAGEARDRNVGYLMESAEDAIMSAERERVAGELRFAMNRAYYACFYAASAVLLSEGRQFVKHAGVRSTLHKDLVNSGRLSDTWGHFYDEMFRARQNADYGMFVELDESWVVGCIDRARQFVAEMKGLLGDS